MLFGKDYQSQGHELIPVILQRKTRHTGDDVFILYYMVKAHLLRMGCKFRRFTLCIFLCQFQISLKKKPLTLTDRGVQSVPVEGNTPFHSPDQTVFEILRQ